MNPFPSKGTPTIPTAVLGFPRIGRQRELKFALEAFWKAPSSAESETALVNTARTLRQQHWQLQQAAGITHIPSNDFSLYDHVLDALVLTGTTPIRFCDSSSRSAQQTGPLSLAEYFQMARGTPGHEGPSATAMEMTKWFDTNYHYLVPEWSAGLSFQPDTRKLLAEFREAKALGILTRPILVGPVTLLRLGKSIDGIDPLSLLPQLTTAYVRILRELAEAGAAWVQIDEPILVTDLPSPWHAAFRTSYAELSQARVKLMLTTYFGALGENLNLAVSLGTAGIHIDAVRAPEQVEAVASALAPHQTLSVGCVDGRNIWLTDLAKTHARLASLQARLGPNRLEASTSCPLLHVPYTTRTETALDEDLCSWLAFAEEKLAELRALANGPLLAPGAFQLNALRLRTRAAAASSTNPAVRAAVARLEQQHFTRSSPYAERAKLQQQHLQLPSIPTTTIGSFPQTAEIRQHRAAHRKGHLDDASYRAFLREETTHCIRQQESIGLDVLVHGEFERNDMVEYFGEHLRGFAFTSNGWVQSYGSRCVKPPIIYGDVSRPAPITVEWSTFAQSLTRKPVKGMLTGPVTILQWSFLRNDIPERDTAFQIALALRDEVRDLEAAGIAIIQMDEPALREGLPLREADQPSYLNWATEAFRLSTSGVRDATQIHTHMCYCEFESVLPAIAALDADVLSMESTRSGMEMLAAFRRSGYPNEIGPGIYDIHSPRVPSIEEMHRRLTLALDALRPEQLWANPDCGLKTRKWPEVIEALGNMVAAARLTRTHILQQE